MSSTDIIENMAQGWNRSPSSVGRGTARTGVSAALWTDDGYKVSEVVAVPHEDQHVVVLQFLPFEAEWFLNDQLRHSGSFRAGDVSLVPARQHPRAVMRGRFACLHIYLPDAIVAECLMSLDSAQACSGIELIDPRCAQDKQIARIGADLLAEMRGNEHLSQLRIDALGQDVAVQLLRRHSNLARMPEPDQPAARGGLAPWQVRRCVEMLTANLSQEVLLSALATEAGLSTFHFARAFKQSVGIPPHAFQHRVRMERAKELLVTTDLPVTQIALEVGYQSSQALARAFLQSVGVSPSAYRRERRA